MTEEYEDFGEAIAESLTKVAHAITPLDTMRGTDANGGSVGSLTEAIMGVTAGLVRIADAIEYLAEVHSSRRA